MNNGWISVPRRIVDHWIWQQPRKFQNFLKLVMLANYTEGSAVFGNKTYTVQRGQVASPLRALAKSLDCTKQTLLTFLELLQRCGMIEKETIDSKFTLITIADYDEYSPRSANEEEGADAQAGNQESANLTNLTIEQSEIEKQPKKTNKNSNQNKNDKKPSSEAKSGEAEKPSLQTQIRPDQIINNNSSYAARARTRERGEEFFKNIRENEQFWIDTSDLLKTPIPKLKELANEVFLKLRRSFDDFEDSDTKNRKFLVNSLRQIIKREKEEQKKAQQQNETKPDYNGNKAIRPLKKADARPHLNPETNDRERRRIELTAYVAQNLGTDADAPGSRDFDF